MKLRHLGRLRLLLLAAALVAALLVPSAAAARAGTAVSPPAGSAARTTSYAATIKDGRAAAQALLAESGAASLSLALVSGDRIVWQEAFGYADKATSAAPQAATMYGIGSVSKVVAAVAAMRLVDQGKLGLDTPLVHYLPALAARYPVYGQVTLRMLLDHSSGFPGSTYGDLFTSTYFPGYLQEVMDAVATERPKTTPGLLNVYCNDGFTLVEALVREVSGKSYAEFVQDEIFAPLGMTHSAYPVRTFTPGTYALCYRGDAVQPFEVANSFASGGMYSTPEDMSRLATMLMHGGTYGGIRVLSADAVAEMGTDQTLGSFDPVPSGSTRYGLGWDTVAEPGLAAVGVTAWNKGGDTAAYHAGFMVAPGARLAVTVVAVTPLDSGDCEALGQRVLVHALVDQGTIRRLPRPLPAKAPPLRTATAAQLDAAEGFWGGSGMVFRVTAAAGDPQSLAIDVLAGDTWQRVSEGFRMRTDTRYHRDGGAGSVSTVAAAGRTYFVQTSVGSGGHYLDRLLLAQKLQPLPVLSPAWQARAGHAWLAVNGRPDSRLYSEQAGPLLTIGDVPGLPGYVRVTTPAYRDQVVDPSESDTVGSMFLQIPGFGSRDLEDAVVTKRGAEDWVQWGSTVYRPKDPVPALAAGANTVTIGAEGYGEWRGLATAAKVSIEAGGTGGPTAWWLYDAGLAVVGGGTTFPATMTAPGAGCSLLLFGPAGASAAVQVTPAAGAAAGPAGAAGASRAVPALPVYRPPLD